MEVCGRYHHWMPILVRVTHRDVFTLWCLTHLRALATRALTGARTASTDTLQVAWAAAAQAAPYRQ
jgi:heme/copper-type cytochrome/quinol oxidase subunit 2